MKKSVVQTGAQIQFGGLNDGFIKVGYQLPTLLAVAAAPTAEAARQTARKATNPNNSRWLIKTANPG